MRVEPFLARNRNMEGAYLLTDLSNTDCRVREKTALFLGNL
jgi:hypothetical protein